MERVFLEHGFGPFCRADSRLLILGSFPSVKSREANFFYGHPQNRFWPLLARLCREEPPVSLDEKKALLERHHIALYDVIERCSIVGSSDSSIRDVVPADLRSLGIPAVKLPSSSPANAACSMEQLVRLWGEALDPILRRTT